MLTPPFGRQNPKRRHVRLFLSAQCFILAALPWGRGRLEERRRSGFGLPGASTRSRRGQDAVNALPSVVTCDYCEHRTWGVVFETAAPGPRGPPCPWSPLCLQCKQCWQCWARPRQILPCARERASTQQLATTCKGQKCIGQVA